MFDRQHHVVHGHAEFLGGGGDDEVHIAGLEAGGIQSLELSFHRWYTK